MVITYIARVRINRVMLPINPARGQLNREKCFFPCPRSRLKIWSRETGSAVPSRVSLLISILRLNLVLTYGTSPEFREGVHLFCRDDVTPEDAKKMLGTKRWDIFFAIIPFFSSIGSYYQV